MTGNKKLRKVWFDLTIYEAKDQFTIGSFSVNENELNGLTNLDVINYVYLNFRNYVDILRLYEFPNQYDTYYTIDRYFGCYNIPCIKYKTVYDSFSYMIVTNIHRV